MKGKVKKSWNILILCPYTAIFSQWAVISFCPLKERRIMKEMVNMFKNWARNANVLKSCGVTTSVR